MSEIDEDEIAPTAMLFDEVAETTNAVVKRTNMDQLIAKILELRTKVSELEAEAEELRVERNTLENNLMEAMASMGVSQLGSSLGTATMQRKVKYALSNWEEFMAYVVETESYDLLQKRISTKAVGERLAADEEVPGIQGVQVFTVSIRKK
jgi:seryl-tRNA synthetase